MAFFQSAVGTLQTLVIALGAGLGIWGAINLMEGYGNDNPGAKCQEAMQVIGQYTECWNIGEIRADKEHKEEKIRTTGKLQW